MIGRLTAALLEKALAAAALWPDTMRISFNLSAEDIATPETIATVLSIMEKSGVDSSRIDFEITETAAMRDFDKAETALCSLRRTGAKISLDDFGTGYSSLNHVHRLKPDKIKIDRSFISDITFNAASRDIVKTVVNLCHSLGIACIVEGVETEQQMRLLVDLGCILMQGYLLGRPTGQAGMNAFIAKNAPAAIGLRIAAY